MFLFYTYKCIVRMHNSNNISMYLGNHGRTRTLTKTLRWEDIVDSALPLPETWEM